MPHKITVRTNGQTLTVNASVSHWTSEALALAASTSNDVESTTTTTITSDYDLWFANTATEATITVKQLDGTTLLAQAFPVTPGHPNRTLNPAPSALQLATDVRPVTGLMPAGAIAETVPRHVGPFASTAALTSGRLLCAAIDLKAGQVVSSVSVMGGVATDTPTNQWFALYDKDLALLGQTADDTTTAWALNTVKTLSFASPITVTYSGLHYVGIMVKATTPSTLYCATNSTALGSVAPKLMGLSTTGLTDTAPDPAGAFTASAYIPYAYVS